MLYIDNLDMHISKNIFEYMVKNTTYSKEKEFRFVFPVMKNKERQDYLEIKCPKAVKFCKIINTDIINNKENIIKFKKDLSLEDKECNMSVFFYQEITDLGLKHADTNFYQGFVCMQSGKYEESIEYFDTAIKLESKYISPHINKGFALDKIGKFNEALECCDKAIKLESNARMYYNKGVILSKLCRWKKTNDCLKISIKLNSKNPDKLIEKNAFFIKGFAYGKLHRYKKAILCFKKVLRKDPNSVETYFNKGVAHRNLGEEERDVDCFVEALSRYPPLTNIFYKEWFKLEHKLVEE